MEVTVCVGSSCHLKGSYDVVNRLRQLVKEYELEDTVQLAGAFCMGDCQKGVCVAVDGKNHSVTPATVDFFFDKNVLNALKEVSLSGAAVSNS